MIVRLQMKVTNIVVGALSTNCYLLEKGNKVILIDPGDNFLKIQNHLKNKEIVAIFITHYHFDHIGALEDIIESYKVPVFDYKKEEGIYQIGPFTFQIIETKGHSKDSVTFYFEKEKMMFCGDFIFKGSIGRCDLEGGNEKEMEESINKIKKFPDVSLFPGHGKATTLQMERIKNPYFILP